MAAVLTGDGSPNEKGIHITNIVMLNKPPIDERMVCFFNAEITVPMAGRPTKTSREAVSTTSCVTALLRSARLAAGARVTLGFVLELCPPGRSL